MPTIAQAKPRRVDITAEPLRWKLQADQVSDFAEAVLHFHCEIDHDAAHPILAAKEKAEVFNAVISQREAEAVEKPLAAVVEKFRSSASYQKFATLSRTLSDTKKRASDAADEAANALTTAREEIEQGRDPAKWELKHETSERLASVLQNRLEGLRVGVDKARAVAAAELAALIDATAANLLRTVQADYERAVSGLEECVGPRLLEVRTQRAMLRTLQRDLMQFKRL